MIAINRMADYRLIMLLVLQQHPYRQIEARARCSHRAIARTRRVLDTEQITTTEQLEALNSEDLDRLFTDGRRSITSKFVPFDIDKIVAARVGRKKPALKVLWSRYLTTESLPGARHYGYNRFCELIAEHVRINDLTAPIAHTPGHTMQVDWAGTRMQLTDPITREHTSVSVFVATLPYSGLVFACGTLDEKMPAWLDCHRRAFEYVRGVPLVVVPDNASTASNQTSKASRARDVNPAYAEFLEHYQTAAVPARAYRPRDKRNVESGVKIVTNWVIHYLADQVFVSLDDLNAAIAAQIDVINARTPFRGESRSRRDWLEELERSEILELPATRWESVARRKAKVHRDWYIQIDTIKYSLPYEFAGLTVDVSIINNGLEVLAAGEVIASHQLDPKKNGYVTNPKHAPRLSHRHDGPVDAGLFRSAGRKDRPVNGDCDRTAAERPQDRSAGIPVMHERPRAGEERQATRP